MEKKNNVIENTNDKNDPDNGILETDAEEKEKETALDDETKKLDLDQHEEEEEGRRIENTAVPFNKNSDSLLPTASDSEGDTKQLEQEANNNDNDNRNRDNIPTERQQQQNVETDNRNHQNNINSDDTNNQNNNGVLGLPDNDFNFTTMIEPPQITPENLAPVQIEDPTWVDGRPEDEGEQGEQLPHAYPINIEPFITAVRILSFRGDQQSQTQPSQEGDEPGSTKTSSSCFSSSSKTKSFILTIVLIGIVVGSITVIKMKERTNSESPDMTTIMDNQTLASEENNQATDDTMGLDDKNTGTKSSTVNNDEEESNEKSSIDNKDRYNYTCYTDPHEIQYLEWNYYDQGKDLSQKRTYIICPHTIMKVFGYEGNLLTFDNSEGEVFHLTIFLPNVHVKCGLDGSLSNNCTFFGKTIHILIDDDPYLFVNYRLPDNIKKENITIEGFRFTQALRGVNILNLAHYALYTVRDCLFDVSLLLFNISLCTCVRNLGTLVVCTSIFFLIFYSCIISVEKKNNSQMFSSIRTTAFSAVDNHATIENCTFVNNTYYHNPLVAATIFDGWIPIIAVIMVYSLDSYWNPSLRMPFDPDTMIMDVSVSNCVFHNNVFLSRSDTVVAAVVNALPPFTSLSVTDSCFVDNEGYSSGVISISEGDIGVYYSPEPTTQFYSGNQFIGNMPKEDHKASCILSRQHIYFDDDGLPERSELQEECEEYDDTTSIDSIDMCLL